MAPSSSGEIYELPEHAGDDGLSDWLMPASSIAAPARVHSQDVASEIDRLLNAARAALAQAEASAVEEAADESSSTGFAWPTWNAAKSNTGTVFSPDACESTVRVVVGKLPLAATQLTAFRNGAPLPLCPVTSTDADPTLVEVRVDGRTRARGMLVVHEGRFAVKITQIVGDDGSLLSATSSKDRQTQEDRS